MNIFQMFIANTFDRIDKYPIGFLVFATVSAFIFVIMSATIAVLAENKKYSQS